MWPAIMIDRLDPIDEGIGSTIDPDKLGLERRLWMTVFQSLAIYNSIELVLIVLFTFKRFSGLYFYSLIVSACGAAFHDLAFLLNDNALVKIRLIPIVLMLASWNCMVTGHLYEKIQIMVFFLQETILSTIYLVKCYRYWVAESLRTSSRIRSMIIHLVLVNVLVVCLDISVVYFEWTGDYVIQTSYKGFVYSVKLKLELSILNKLVELVKVARNLELQEDVSRQLEELEEEWTNTLDRTIGTGHKRNSNERSDAPLVSFPEMGEPALQTPDRAFPQPTRDNIHNNDTEPAPRPRVGMDLDKRESEYSGDKP
ncbi:hypothetical protein F5Y16DRAFT_404200 [Xylariaceae sp. FL0255]|nr:hypothetical protein F5Y16DRAFT_404200 [Xylariaceae sp. FL0255]